MTRPHCRPSTAFANAEYQDCIPVSGAKSKCYSPEATEDTHATGCKPYRHPECYKCNNYNKYSTDKELP